MKLLRTCPLCRHRSNLERCCGVALAMPFRMSANRVRALRAYVHGRKGLDDDTYRLHLGAVGARSTLELNREQHDALMKRLAALPDAPPRHARVQRREAAHA